MHSLKSKINQYLKWSNYGRFQNNILTKFSYAFGFQEKCKFSFQPQQNPKEKIQLKYG